jgi:hypothetical protein
VLGLVRHKQNTNSVIVVTVGNVKYVQAEEAVVHS